MFNPNVDPFFRHVVRIEQQELLKEIESNRLFHQLPGLLYWTGHKIEATGHWIKSHTRSKMVEPCPDAS